MKNYTKEEINEFLFSKTKAVKNFNDLSIKFKRLTPHGPPLPEYAHKGDSGMDLRADFSGLDPQVDLAQYVLPLLPGQRTMVPLGFAIEIPEGFEAQIRSRSGMALKNGVVVLNSPGTVDSNYRGPMGVCLINHGDTVFKIKHGDRIAQMVIAKVEYLPTVEVKTLNNSNRGQGGWGSSGTK
jgi:dUTP pyrophosphatase